MPDHGWAPDEQDWRRAAELVDWSRAFDEVWRPDGIRGEWFPGGLLNVSANCVDRHARARAHHHQLAGHDHDVRISPGSESHNEFWSRVDPALRRLSDTHADRTVLVFTHGGVIDRSFVTFLGLPPDRSLTGLHSLRERGLSDVLLYVDESNEAAVKTYVRLGFERHATDVMYRRG